MRRRPFKLMLIGAPGVDASQLGLHVARAVGRPFFEPTGRHDESTDSEREWFDCIAATSGPAVVATRWSIAQHAFDVRTDDQWLVFVDSPPSNDHDTDHDTDYEITQFREQADLSVHVRENATDETVDEITRAWRRRINGTS